VVTPARLTSFGGAFRVGGDGSVVSRAPSDGRAAKEWVACFRMWAGDYSPFGNAHVAHAGFVGFVECALDRLQRSVALQPVREDGEVRATTPLGGRACFVVSSYLGWAACFLSGSDTASNLLFGNLQVAVAHQLHLNPVLLAATNSSGAVAGKMISPQNIAIGVTTVGLIGQEGKVLRSTFWHSVLLAALIGLVALGQAYLIPTRVP
jgi:hypothetical protein